METFVCGMRKYYCEIGAAGFRNLVRHEARRHKSCLPRKAVAKPQGMIILSICNKSRHKMGNEDDNYEYRQ